MIAAFSASRHPDQKFFRYALGAGLVDIYIIDVLPCGAPDEAALAEIITAKLARLWSSRKIYLLVVKWEGRMIIHEGGSGEEPRNL